MDDTPPTAAPAREDEASDTLIVPPPTFRERLLAAQRARANEVRPSLAMPMHQRDTQSMPRVEVPPAEAKPLSSSELAPDKGDDTPRP